MSGDFFIVLVFLILICFMTYCILQALDFLVILCTSLG